MKNTNIDANKFYDQLIKMIDQSLAVVLSKTSVTNGNLDFEGAIANSKILLEKFRDQTNKDIRELQELAEWDTFTIAFYGETNAGKSTLIETLRILLGDGEKLAMQQKFKMLAKELHVDPNSISALETSIKQLELKLAESQDQTEIFKKILQDEEQQQSAQLDALRASVERKRKNLGLWQRLLYLFKKLDEEKSLSAHELRFTQFKDANKAKLEVIIAEPLKVSSELNSRRSDLAQIENSFAQLAPLQDGNIIGNGRSDFTLQSHAYCFTADNQKFQLIDVPGIEGDEKQVMSAIDASVKKAHAVFYVTRAATPPGSGSEGKEGTIDKIKRQLGKQTEVWAIYNKSATNPQVLQGETLINKNDSIGLVEMNKSLSGMLGQETYKGHICVSGMPAFLASAICLLPNNSHIKSRDKFLATMSASDILDRSGMNAFLKFIRTEICQNFQKKIDDANLKKIRSCLQDGIYHLQKARDNFAAAAQKLEVQQKFSSLQIDALLSGTSKKLKSECHDQLSEKKSAMRTAIYNYIESDQTNDDFKERLTDQINDLKNCIGADLEVRFAKVFEAFKHDAGEIIRANQKNVDDILHYTVDSPFSSLKLKFNSNFKMDNGINVVGLISTLGGAAALIWASFLASNPVGWTTAAVLGAVGLVFSLYKAVRSFFSSDYKKEQQRKSADDNLDKVFTKLSQMLDENLESASKKINEALLETKKQMRIPYEQSVNTKAALEGVAAKMVTMRDNLSTKSILAAVDTTVPTFTKAAAFSANTL